MKLTKEYYQGYKEGYATRSLVVDGTDLLGFSLVFLIGFFIGWHL